MTAVLNIVFAGVAGVAILSALYYGGRAVIRRGQPTDSAYNVGRLEARRSVQIDLIRALASIVVALIFLGAFGLTPRPVEPLISPTEPVLVEATEVPTELPVETIVPTDLPAPEQAIPTAEPTAVPTNPPTDEPTAAPTNTPEPVSNTAIVSSGVGVWLRATPSTTGEQLEWLLDGTVLTLLDGQETADDLLWQQVQTETGLIGWVAADFILISE
ncbi:SH3 domain-containing protein [Candidatus Leptofilum sp.]|uniref:SH3 domain-containing protein n=1 Tax=Candidatus Leptofilum sp. TaxID=3241576 RepID=UPI003B595F71